MKKILFAGIVILFAVLFVTCDGLFPEEETNVEYTDVEYLAGGSQVRVYLDGVGVPKTKAQRAMSLDLSKMAYDFLEVIFFQPAAAAGGGNPAIPLTIARAAWELGQPAGIGGVYRTAGGVDYGGVTFTAASACIFVGKTDGKTLLGVGKLTNVDDETTATTSVKTTTTFVTFSVAAIQTGLLIGAENAGDAGDAADVRLDSFKFIDGGTTGTYISRDGHSSRSPLGNESYPMYSLNPTLNVTQWATYDFDLFVGTSGIVKADLLGTIKIADKVNVQKRLPRYMDGGHYLAPKSHIDTKTTVYYRDSDTTPNVPPATIAYPAVGSGFTGKIPLMFTTKGSGIFSFFIEVPVYMARVKSITSGVVDWDNDSTNSGPKPTKWYIRTGLDSELYSLDDGKASGGSVLMGVGVSSLDWLQIKWEWVE